MLGSTTLSRDAIIFLINLKLGGSQAQEHMQFGMPGVNNSEKEQSGSSMSQIYSTFAWNFKFDKNPPPKEGGGKYP